MHAPEVPPTPPQSSPDSNSEAVPDAAILESEWIHGDSRRESGTEESATENTSTASPLDSIPAAIREAVEARGFDGLTSVQRAVLEPSSADRDLLISSQTGSGKTIAVGMLLSRGLVAACGGGERPGISALVITPTRELASQVGQELSWLFANVRDLAVTVVTGGTSVGQERRALAQRPMVVVGTPGRMLDHIRSAAISTEGVRELVLDEADQMLDMGFREELEAILEAVPEERTTHLVSATFPPGIKKLAQRYQRDPLHVEGTRHGVANADIAHVAHLVYEADRYASLVNILLLAEGERTLVFVNTRSETTEIAEELSKDGFHAMPLSGELQQSQRTRTLAAFRAGTVTVLVATDVAARGLDIPDVGTVIQAGTPMDAQVYIHRSGRTGRAGKKGRCVLLVPSRRERRIRRVLNDAGVESEWCAIPGRAEVEKALTKRTRRQLFESIDREGGPPEAELEYARKLASDRDPVRVIATLLEMVKPAHRCRPQEIEPVDRNTRARKHHEQQRGQQHSHPWRQGETRHGGSGNQYRSNAASSNSTRFTVNWGSRSGASPQRLLAMLCRRGKIQGKSVGAIRMEANTSTFEIRESAAQEFERNACRFDPRDPELFIRRERSAFPTHNGYQPRHGYQPSGGTHQAGGAGRGGKKFWNSKVEHPKRSWTPPKNRHPRPQEGFETGNTMGREPARDREPARVGERNKENEGPAKGGYRAGGTYRERRFAGGAGGASEKGRKGGFRSDKGQRSSPY